MSNKKKFKHQSFQKQQAVNAGKKGKILEENATSALDEHTGGKALVDSMAVQQTLLSEINGEMVWHESIGASHRQGFRPINTVVSEENTGHHIPPSGSAKYVVEADSGFVGRSPSLKFFDRIRKSAQEAQHIRINVGTIPESVGGPHHVDASKAVKDWAHFDTLLSSPSTMRTIVDGKQAQIFANMNSGPPSDFQEELHSPFDNMYIEFTEPLDIGEQEPLTHIFQDSCPNGSHNCDCKNYQPINASTGLPNASVCPNNGAPPCQCDDEEIRKGKDKVRSLLYITGYQRRSYRDGDVDVVVANVTFFLEDDEGNVADRSFLYDIATGQAITTLPSCINHKFDRSRFHKEFLEDTIRRGEERGLRYIEAQRHTDPNQNRYSGWWERIVCSYADFLGWMFTYMTAKGIHVVEKMESRSERRRNEKTRGKNNMPSPWHIVTVEPRKIKVGNAGEFPEGENEPSSGRQHSYRYDVMGFIRLGRHRRKDGSYSLTKEWVRPHQRGIANDTYIPKISKYEGPADKQYMPSVRQTND